MRPPKTILLGTHNPAKIDILQAALQGLPLHIVLLAQLGIRTEAKENGQSAEENAEAKARFYFACTHLPTLAIDGGLYIQAFPPEKQPGVYVRRIGGIAGHVDDEQVLQHYLRELEAVGGQSLGSWEGSLSLAVRANQVFTQHFSFTTLFTSQRKGPASPGLALDPMMIDPATGKYYPDLPIQDRPYTPRIRAFVEQHWEDL